MTTAVSLCETCLGIPFTGDINNFNQVSEYLSVYLDSAKVIWEDAKESYYSNFNY